MLVGYLVRSARILAVRHQSIRANFIPMFALILRWEASLQGFRFRLAQAMGKAPSRVALTTLRQFRLAQAMDKAPSRVVLMQWLAALDKVLLQVALMQWLAVAALDKDPLQVAL